MKTTNRSPGTGIDLIRPFPRGAVQAISREVGSQFNVKAKNMWKTSPLVLAGALCLLGSGTASAQLAHDPNHLSAFEMLCLAAHDNEDFCTCTREAVETHLPPEHASFTDEALISDDLPEDIAAVLDEAVLACRDTHVEFEDDTDDGEESEG